jgi:hypothetical protein
MAAKRAMMPMTTRSSMSVKAWTFGDRCGADLGIRNGATGHIDREAAS